MIRNTKLWLWIAFGVAGTLAFGCQAETPSPPTTKEPVSETPIPASTPAWAGVDSWAYQLTGYPGGRLDEIAASGYDLVVIDLARDGSDDFFTREEIGALQASGKIVLAYFEIGAIEEYRPEWDATPDEQYARYWDPRWWPVVQGRIDQALAAGFDGAYLDMVVAYEEISTRASGLDEDERARAMVDLIIEVSAYAKGHDPAFKIVPQNAPELHTLPGYLDVIDGLGMEELYFLATDKPCDADWCEENRKAVAAIRAAGKLVLTVDYAQRQNNVEAAYAQSRADGFVPCVTTVELDKLLPPSDTAP